MISISMLCKLPASISHTVDQSKILRSEIAILGSLCWDNSAAVFPKKVLLPVASTVASTSPLATVEPIKHFSSLNMVTGNDSPMFFMNQGTDSEV